MPVQFPSQFDVAPSSKNSGNGNRRLKPCQLEAHAAVNTQPERQMLSLRGTVEKKAAWLHKDRRIMVGGGDDQEDAFSRLHRHAGHVIIVPCQTGNSLARADITQNFLDCLSLYRRPRRRHDYLWRI